MVQSFSLSWESHKSSICHGFSGLQQNGEFVDMTLAADGHFVKVHQVIIALASSYLKDLITSAPCQHPVIFLNNVSYKTLCSLLEYMYMGEVIISADNLSSFVEAAKALHIKGLENMAGSKEVSVKPAMKRASPEIVEEAQSKTKISRYSRQIGLPVTARKIVLKQEDHDNSLSLPTYQTSNTSVTSKDDTHDYTDVFDDSTAQDSDDGIKYGDSSQESTNQNTTISKPMSNLQFTVSIRGSLQIILNRYIYNLHSVTHRTGVRRWRCVDYRNHRCMAFVVTKGNVVLNRANLHNHSFHDKKILAKLEKKAVYSALDDVEGYKDKEEDRDSPMEQEEYLTIDRNEMDKTSG